MKSIHKTKDHMNLSNSSPLQHQSKRNYYFHPNEDFREDPDWKAGDSDTSKAQRLPKKSKKFLNS